MSQILRPQAYTSAKTYNCVSCGDYISSDSNKRGMIRTKCDSCKKEKDRLVNVIIYWQNKVGIKFALDGDWN